jgi:hypothetical protein
VTCGRFCMRPFAKYCDELLDVFLVDYEIPRIPRYFWRPPIPRPRAPGGTLRGAIDGHHGLNPQRPPRGRIVILHQPTTGLHVLVLLQATPNYCVGLAMHLHSPSGSIAKT